MVYRIMTPANFIYGDFRTFDNFIRKIDPLDLASVPEFEVDTNNYFLYRL